MSKRIAILGSTGSIGTNALEVIEHLGPPYRAVALSAHRQAERLIEQARRHRPAAVAITDEKPEEQLLRQLEQLGCDVFQGPDGIVEMVRRDDIDLVLAGIVGAAGLPAVFAAVETGKTIALANKESLVIAGSLLIPEARSRGVRIIPVDSEHSAIFQAMHCGRRNEVRRIILTASGGPFRTASAEEMEQATIEDALSHPIWQMGSKITIDSATMFNKALELIEACWLFDLRPQQVQIVIHPESVIHSMVEFVDGSVMAQLSPPDMRTPIQYALTYPRRTEGIGNCMQWDRPQVFHFEPPDLRRFPALRLAYDVAQQGGTAGAVLNAANEAAVEAFMAGKISFGDIARFVEMALEAHPVQSTPTMDDLLEADRRTRKMVDSLVAEGRPVGRRGPGG